MLNLNQYLENTPKEKHSYALIAYLASIEHIQRTSPLIADAIINELKNQRSHLKLIASENFSSLAVQLAMGNLLTDKYAEGYPNHRFYAGCENVDICELEAIKQVKEIFDCDHAYVQPHSGADANLVAFWSILVHRIQDAEVEALGKKKIDELNDKEYERIRMLMMQQKIMGMSLNAGGHLTHGYRHNISSKMMHAVSYGLDPKTETLDYKALEEQVKVEKPIILLAGYSAYSRRLNFAQLREIANTVNAVLMVDMAHFSGLIAGKVFAGDYNPVPFADIITSTTHKTLRGPRGGFIMCKKEFAEIVNKGCPLVLGGPLPHVIAAKAIAFKEANTPAFQEYAHQIVNNSVSLAEELMKRGARISSGKTENHLMVVDVSSFGITGRQAEKALREIGITVNRNTIYNDPNGPWYTSGIRIGTPAITTLGMGKEETGVIADAIIAGLQHTQPIKIEKTGQMSRAKYHMEKTTCQKIKSQIFELLNRFPLYPELDF